MQAQKTTAISGEYYLQGVMETASGFRLNDDSTFEFFFSYGALDREGKGTWKRVDDKIVFNSPVPKGQCFSLVSNKQIAGDKITLKIREENAFFRSAVYAIVKSGNKQLEAPSNKDGEITFPKQRVDSIVLLFEFAPEKTAVFAFNDQEHNYFEFCFDATALEVFFDDLRLTLEEQVLKGQHPLLKPGEYYFMKN